MNCQKWTWQEVKQGDSYLKKFLIRKCFLCNYYGVFFCLSLSHAFNISWNMEPILLFYLCRLAKIPGPTQPCPSGALTPSSVSETPQPVLLNIQTGSYKKKTKKILSTLSKNSIQGIKHSVVKNRLREVNGLNIIHLWLKPQRKQYSYTPALWLIG